MLIDLAGKVGLIIGVANENSIAWGCAERIHQCKAELALTYGNQKTQKYTKHLAEKINCPIYLPCDVTKPEEIAELFATIQKQWGKLDFLIHSIAFAPQNDLHGRVIDCSLEGFATAMNVSCYSLIQLSKLAEPLMKQGGSILSISYYGANKVVKSYNLMGIAKAALESAARYLAWDLGKSNIRLNILSPGPIMTRAASGINQFNDLLDDAIKKSPIARGVDIYSVGNMAAFMVSDLSKDITGETIYIDAGSSVVA